MSISEVIEMNYKLWGGIVVAVLFTGGAAVAQSASKTSATAKGAHARHSFFTSDQKRADLPAHVERMFKQLDRNHDGFITKDELAASKSQFDERMTKSAPKRAAKLFDHLDTNHDGQITRAEVEAARAARLAADGKTARPLRRPAGSVLFARADANKDGVITRAEFDGATANGKITLRHANMRGSAIARLFDAADVNKDGRVSLEEAQQATQQQFDAADLNHDGVLTPDERRQASKSRRGTKRES
jgi:Ca2+-binding EF-hand superfamily protein